MGSHCGEVNTFHMDFPLFNIMENKRYESNDVRLYLPQGECRLVGVAIVESS